MKNVIFPAFLAIALLTACAPAQANTANVQNTAIAIAWTGTAFTQKALPTATPLPPTFFTPTAIIAVILPTPYPTQPPFIPFMTPDAIQVARWKEYQIALAKSILSFFPPEEVICEWDILGQSSQEVYVWADCAVPGKGDDGLPAVIHLNADNSVQNAEVPRRGSGWNADVQRMFPADVREKFGLGFVNYIFHRTRKEEMLEHLIYRATHPEVPPLIVLSATPTP